MERNRYPYQMIEEALDELLVAARYTIFYDKTFKKVLKRVKFGNLGFPSAILLFSIVDIIGNCFKGDSQFIVSVDGNDKIISGKGHTPFYILNSKYFDQDLSENFIKYLYDRFRSKLVHNGLIGKDGKMYPTSTIHEKAFFSTESNGKGKYSVSLEEMFYLCEKAVKLFKPDLKDVVSNSRLGKAFP